MKQLSDILLEKLKINKDTKIISNPNNLSDLITFIDTYLEDKYSIKEDEKAIQISELDKSYEIDVYLDKKYQNDELYNYFTQLREAIRRTPMGPRIQEAWCDNKGVRIHYKLKK